MELQSKKIAKYLAEIRLKTYEISKFEENLYLNAKKSSTLIQIFIAFSPQFFNFRLNFVNLVRINFY